MIDIENIENFEKDIPNPADTLDSIYKLVGKKYITIQDGKKKKKTRQINRTVQAIDYENLYLHTKEKVPSLKELIDTLNEFFSEET
ncbi:MAG: hypothetical protein QM493_05280 [Sulfurovum sp.]